MLRVGFVTDVQLWGNVTIMDNTTGDPVATSANVSYGPSSLKSIV